MENVHKHKYRRNLLPHWDFGEIAQTITYRLADSIPPNVCNDIRTRLHEMSQDKQNLYSRIQLENWLHEHRYGSCILEKPEAARIVIDTWRFYDGKDYDLYEWVVMTNHVHVLIRQYIGKRLCDIISAWKGYTSKMISRKFQIPQPVWLEGYWDRTIRDANHFQIAREYILNNPEKAGFTDWPYVSSRYGKLP